jgi:hypothetical protein
MSSDRMLLGKMPFDKMSLDQNPIHLIVIFSICHLKILLGKKLRAKPTIDKIVFDKMPLDQNLQCPNSKEVASISGYFKI